MSSITPDRCASLDEAVGEYCLWPNEIASAGRLPMKVRPLAERRAEWAALQPRAQHRTQPKRFGRGGRYASHTAKSWRFFPKTVVFYTGSSQLTGAPILVAAGAQTSNRKTGPMVQIWILRADMAPIAAVRSGGDEAICGQCRHRGDGRGQARSCYVEWWRSPENIYQAITGTGRGTGKNVERASIYDFGELARGKQLRIGAYGDPVAVPLSVWAIVIQHAAGWTAYTHQWRLPIAQDYRTFCMASVDSEAEQVEAAALGWRTFRVRPTIQTRLLPGEIICPASEEAGHKVQCAECELCRGSSRPAKNIVIAAHGQYALHFRRTAEAHR